MSEQAEIKEPPGANPERVTDVLFLLGSAMAFSGIAMVHLPSALITAGCSLMLLAIKRGKAA